MHVTSMQKQKLKEKYGNEMVFAVPSYLMAHIQDGLSNCAEAVDTLSQYDKLGQYMLRYDVEMNNSFQQLIPFVLVKHQKTGDYFVAERIAHGDDRLSRKFSLGMGGHIDSTDGHNEVIMAGLERELHEELFMELTSKPKFIGTIRELTSETSDHTGFVFEVEVSSASIKETDKLRGLWMSPKQLVDSYFSFEGWSKLIIDDLYESLNLK